MDNFKSILELWYIKTIIGGLITIFAPINISFIILVILIIIDTCTGMAQALKFKRFSSSSLRKAVNKIITYGVCIITTRLLEVGILYFFETTLISQLTIGFLIITEAVSTLENLVLIGVPIPKNFVNIIFDNIKILGLKEAFKQSIDEYSEIREIDEIINYQVPTIKNEAVRKLIELNFDSWSRVITFIKRNIDEKRIISDEILYYKVISFIETSAKDMRQKWEDYGISKDCIDKFNKWYELKQKPFLQNVKDICYSQKGLEGKKQDLIDKIMILLYQTILDANKSEAELSCKQ